MGILKTKIESHLKMTDKLNDLQTGATSGRRVYENIFILYNCIQKTFINKTELFILSIDFTKAFDSIDRLMMIKVLKEKQIHPKLINLIAEIYTNDQTTLYLNKEKVVDKFLS